jgi:hypothetical protein
MVDINRLVDEEIGNDDKTELDNVVGARKMTCDTVIGSCMGGAGDVSSDAVSENNNSSSNTNMNRQQQQQHQRQYDGGSLSTVDDQEPTSTYSATTAWVQQHRRRMTTMISSYCYRSSSACCYVRRNNSNRTSRGNGTDPSLLKTTTCFLHKIIPTTTAFRALMKRNIIYRKRNWLSGVRIDSIA